jgi:Protein of unknown function (DUF2778)
MAQDDPYASERRQPTAPMCGASAIALYFNGRALGMGGNGASLGYPAVSGKPLANGSFDYSAARQRLGNTGPIPAGNYWINPSELWERPWFSRQTAGWGNYRITLRIYPGTVTHGRGGFFIHGGSTPGSAGCIDLTSRMDQFVLDLRARVGRSNNCYIPVKVEY